MTGPLKRKEKEEIEKRLKDLEDDNWLVRSEGAFVLRKMGEKAAEHEGVIPALIKALKDDNSGVRSGAAGALEKMREERAEL
ncbi:MAG: HEAT repeat domain-containing protein [Asgard group archaeon]|nr:HEAT repeat domain-containing protein [Asgard group archaeon]